VTALTWLSMDRFLSREEALSGLEGQLEVVGLELMAKGIMAGTHSKSRRERVPDFRSCNTETAGAK